MAALFKVLRWSHYEDQERNESLQRSLSTLKCNIADAIASTREATLSRCVLPHFRTDISTAPLARRYRAAAGCHHCVRAARRTARGALISHDPLLAYANSYDEVRYTACFDLYPDRPREIPPADNSPWAPFSHYVFIPGGAGEPMCYWSSELLPQAIVVAGWKAAEAFGGGAGHSVYALGMLKYALLFGLNLAFTLAWWRRRRPVCALANAALLPLLFADTANTLY